MPLCGQRKLGWIRIEWDTFLVSTDDINLLGKNTNTVMRKSPHALLDTSIEDGLEAN
jgi:hypothetical protein